MFWNKKPQNIESKEYKLLSSKIDLQEAETESLKNKIMLIQNSMKDIKTMITKRLRLELEGDTESEKNKSTSVFLKSDGTPI